MPLSTLRPDLPPALCAIVERLLAKDPADRFASPQELVHEVEEAASAIAGGSRRGPAPLAWDEPEEAWSLGEAAAGGVATAARMHEATRHLQAALGRVADARSRSRRRWLVTIAAAAVAAVVGFGAGRLRSRRSDLLGQEQPRSRSR